MTEDPRCCGSGTCIIDPTGLCWCGQQWDGEKMHFPSQTTSNDHTNTNNADSKGSSAHNDLDKD